MNVTGISGFPYETSKQRLDRTHNPPTMSGLQWLIPRSFLFVFVQWNVKARIKLSAGDMILKKGPMEKESNICWGGTIKFKHLKENVFFLTLFALSHPGFYPFASF